MRKALHSDLVAALKNRFELQAEYTSPNDNRWVLKDHFYVYSIADEASGVSIDIFNVDAGDATTHGAQKTCCQYYGYSEGKDKLCKNVARGDKLCAEGDTDIDDSRQQLAKEVAASNATWKLVNSHYSPYAHYDEAGMKKWFDIMQDAGVQLWLNGHTHGENHDYSSTLQMHFVTNGAVNIMEEIDADAFGSGTKLFPGKTCARALITVATALAVGVVADDDPAYYCDSDSDSYCERNFQAPLIITATSPPSVLSTQQNDLLAARKTCPAATTAGDGADATFTVTIKGEKGTGQFVCMDVSDCANKAADPSTCEPTSCQAPTSKKVCTYHGTSTYKSRSKIGKRTCMCYAGSEGDKCEKEVSNACDVDCGEGGDCVDGECVCKKGFDGKEVDGKKGKTNQRCTRCTNDLACQNNNTCDTESGKCICGPGYTGDTCGATEDSCTKRTDCGIGSFQVLVNGSSACFCTQCSPTCSLCDMNVDATFDCSTCATAAANIAL
ncbi:hypothetical protein PsorP6_000173 [Peronosclerospora sorghi]|uniref:Uncharacterized protein n=1 Tax=Peronosclerospora sorghi TaxID=230839 RepID=A0ACC0WTF5_9STRA|nr:hypothetical protein PsorP6_000173 [Peronosclerospora sorghi]